MFSQSMLSGILRHKFRVPTKGILEQLQNQLFHLWAIDVSGMRQVANHPIGLILMFSVSTMPLNTHKMYNFTIPHFLEIMGHPNNVRPFPTLFSNLDFGSVLSTYQKCITTY